MTETDISRLLGLSKEEKYRYVLEQLVTRQEVWIVYDEDGMVLFESDRGEVVIPVWPHREIAQLFCVDEYADCQPGTVALDDFLKNEMKEAEEQGFLISLMPVPGTLAVLADPTEMSDNIANLMPS